MPAAGAVASPFLLPVTNRLTPRTRHPRSVKSARKPPPSPAPWAELPEPHRVVLVLRHYEDMSFEDIARLTGTPATTLKSRFAAALTRLRARLEELGWRPDEDPS